MRRALAIALLFASSCTFVSDGDECEGVLCGASPPPVEIRVLDVADAEVTVTRSDDVAVDVACSAELDTVCSAGVAEGLSAVGLYLIRVEAPGYETSDSDVMVRASTTGGCCNPGYIGESVTVELSSVP